MTSKEKQQRFLGLASTALFLASFALGVQPAEGTILRVATTGSDVASCGTATTPCRTLQYAVDKASHDDEIRMAGGTYTGVSASGGSTQLARIYNKEVDVRGGFTTSNWSTPNPVASPTVLDAQNLGMVLYIKWTIDGAGSTTLEGLEITGGNANESSYGEEDGGGVHVEEGRKLGVTIDNCHVHHNSADDDGGGIWTSRLGRLTVSDSVVEDNSSDGLFMTATDNVTVTDSIFDDNTARGVAFFGIGSNTVTITGNMIRRNSRGFSGGSMGGGTISGNTVEDNTPDSGLYIRGANDLTISGNTLAGNTGKNGGGLRFSGMSNSVVQNNTATTNSAPTLGYTGGGGFYIDAGETGSVEVNNNTLEGNSAANGGGGMLLLGNVSATGNTLIDNSAFGGGGIKASMMGKLEDNRLIGNTAQVGGGLFLSPFDVSLVGNYYQGNTATNGDGGGIYIYGGFFFGVVTLEGERIVQNSATGKGGGIYLRSDEDDSETTFTNVLVQENTAATGSGIYKLGDITTFKHCTIADNGADGADGVGLYSQELFSGGFTMLNSIVAGQTTGIHVHSGASSIDGHLWGDGAWDNDNDWTGAAPSTANEIWGDPVFSSIGGEGYHIDKTSAARDAAADIGILVDMDGQTRPNPDTGIPDLGADEWSSEFDTTIFTDGFESGNTSAWSVTVP